MFESPFFANMLNSIEENHGPLFKITTSGIPHLENMPYFCDVALLMLSIGLGDTEIFYSIIERRWLCDN